MEVRIRRAAVEKSSVSASGLSVCYMQVIGKRSVHPVKSYNIQRMLDLLGSRKRRSGKISLLVMLALLLAVVLAGLLGNSGHTVNQKLSNQHAADAAAFTTSMWLSRGMNSVTTVNHLVGEASALGVIHDALGGLELRLELKTNTAENRQLDSYLRATARSAPIGQIPNKYVPAPLTDLDRRIIQAVTRRMSPESNPELTGFGTLYDARLTLKRKMLGWLIAKSVANLSALAFPPPLDAIATAVAYGVHIVGTAQIVMIGKEWLLLEAVEGYAKAAGKVHPKILEEQLIPTLWVYAFTVAGLDPEADIDDVNSVFTDRQDALVNRAVATAFDKLQEQNGVEAALLPSPDELVLPVIPEPAPSLQPSSGPMPDGWGDDTVFPIPELPSIVGNMSSQLNRAVRAMNARTIELEDVIEDLDQLLTYVAQRIASGELDEDIAGEAEREERLLNLTINALKAEISELESKLQEIVQQRDSLANIASGNSDNQSQNLSLRHIPQALNVQQERWTQWVRATAPYVDAMRAPILGIMDTHLPLSNAAEHYIKWTNRYTLIKAWQFRSGQRLMANGSDSAEWQTQEKRARLLVLPGTFPSEQPRKGAEPWTRSSTEGKQRAEELFTTLAACHREYDTLFSSNIYPASQSHGLIAYSQAILYNANTQNPSMGNGDQQPVCGWDTLNWDPGTSPAVEWGAAPNRQSARWPWEILQGLDQSPAVKLNWQAKLMPVTNSRLSQAAEAMDGKVAPGMQHAYKHFECVNH
jgi:hypothetical protein